jgi:hypothetical protein
MHNDPSELQTLADGDGLRAYGAADWGGMAVNVNHFPPGFDLTGILQQVPGAACPVPHWGYVFGGSFTVGYSDGTSETISTGEVFHLRAGHDSLRSEAGVSYVEFSPADEQAAMSNEMAKVMGQGAN